MIAIKKERIEANKTSIIKIIPLTVALVAVNFIVSRRYHDPVNLPKTISLILISTFIFAILIITFKIELIRLRSLKIILGLLSAYLVTFIVTGMTQTSLYNVAIGTYRRNNGALVLVCFILIFLYLIANFKTINVNHVYVLIIIIGVIHGLYGIVQLLGKDPIQWNTINFVGIFGTLGNSNFFASTLAVCTAVTTFKGVEIFKKKKFQALSLFTIACLELYLQSATKSQQGFIFLFLVFFIYFLIVNKKRIINYSLAIFFFIISIFMLAGGYRITGLSKFIDPSSLETRINYWIIGLKMGRDHLWTGIGTDRYGDYFSEYVNTDLLNKYGSGLWTDNAHGILMNLFATQGLITTLLWICFFGLVLFFGMKIKPFLVENELREINQLISLFVSYLILVQFTIDSSFVGIWLWMFAGLIVSKYLTQEVKFGHKSIFSSLTTQPSFQRLIFGVLILIITIIPVASYSNGILQSNNYFKALLSAPNDPNNLELREQKRKIMQLVLNTNGSEPYYYFEGGYVLASGQDVGAAIDLIKLGLKKNPRNTNGLIILSELYEGQSLYKEALEVRRRLEKLSPFNLENQRAIERLKSKI